MIMMVIQAETIQLNIMLASKPRNVPGPDPIGTAMRRTVLSALPESNIVLSGLNRNVVGGSSCALRIVRIG